MIEPDLGAARSALAVGAGTADSPGRPRYESKMARRCTFAVATGGPDKIVRQHARAGGIRTGMAIEEAIVPWPSVFVRRAYSVLPRQLGHGPDGYLTLTDRAKDVIKSGGEWISSQELENHLVDHPDVAEAAVVAVPDDKWGERPLATVVLRDGASVDFTALRAFLAERVASWQLPERWSLIPAVPKTSVGKFDKKLIRAQYADGELEVVLVDKA